ncbi:MAG: hypothetical protein EA358_03690 [Flavobacteriales bacterium]|nr:MAG: hypothetical protein EA358_03690 [Flavobacteriales bacterium]
MAGFIASEKGYTFWPMVFFSIFITPVLVIILVSFAGQGPYESLSNKMSREDHEAKLREKAGMTPENIARCENAEYFWSCLGCNHLEDGNYSFAVEAFKVAEEIDEGFKDKEFYLAYCYALVGNFRETVNMCYHTKDTNLLPDILDKLYLDEIKFSNFVTYGNRRYGYSESLYPTCKALTEFSASRYNAAALTIDTYFQLSKNKIAYLKLASAYAMVGKNKEAEQQIGCVSEWMMNKSPLGYFYLTAIYKRLGRLKDSQVAFDKATKRMAKSKDSIHQYLFYYLSGDKNSASDIKQAILEKMSLLSFDLETIYIVKTFDH